MSKARVIYLSKGQGKYRLAQDWGAPPADLVPNQPVIVSSRIADLAEAINRKDGGMTFFVERLTDEGLPLSATPTPVATRPVPAVDEIPFELKKEPQTFVEDLTPPKKKVEKPKTVEEDVAPPKKVEKPEEKPLKKKKKKIGPDGKPVKKTKKSSKPTSRSDGIW